MAPRRGRLISLEDDPLLHAALRALWNMEQEADLKSRKRTGEPGSLDRGVLTSEIKRMAAWREVDERRIWELWKEWHELTPQVFGGFRWP